MNSFFKSKVERTLNAVFTAVIYAAFVLLFSTVRAQSQTLTVVHDINFGKIAIHDISSVARITIETNGAYTYNSNVSILEPPTRGEYEITGGPPNTAYTLTIPPSLLLGGPGGNMTIDNIVILPAVLTTDGAGNATFYLTGRLQTMGGGTSYSNGTYDAGFDVTVNF